MLTGAFSHTSHFYLLLARFPDLLTHLRRTYSSLANKILSKHPLQLIHPLYHRFILLTQIQTNKNE